MGPCSEKSSIIVFVEDILTWVHTTLQNTDHMDGQPGEEELGQAKLETNNFTISSDYFHQFIIYD